MRPGLNLASTGIHLCLRPILPLPLPLCFCPPLCSSSPSSASSSSPSSSSFLLPLSPFLLPLPLPPSSSFPFLLPPLLPSLLPPPHRYPQTSKGCIWDASVCCGSWSLGGGAGRGKGKVMREPLTTIRGLLGVRIKEPATIRATPPTATSNVGGPPARRW